MQRFILSQNIRHFEEALLDVANLRDETTVRTLLARARRDLALLDAGEIGAEPLGASIGPADFLRRREPELQRLFEASQGNQLLIDPGRGLHIVDLTPGYARATMVTSHAILGERLFDVFPDNPEVADADGVSNLYGSLQRVIETRRPHSMSIQRYDVRDAAGRFCERYWRPVNSPIFAETGELVRILHEAEDVTQQVLAGLIAVRSAGADARA